MSIISGFLIHEITVYSTSRDAHNTTTETEVYSNLKCRFVKKTSKIVTAEAEVKEYRAECWIESGVTIQMDYIVDYDGEKYRIVAIDPGISLFGEEDHIKILLK
jgi:hypothetical protein